MYWLYTAGIILCLHILPTGMWPPSCSTKVLAIPIVSPVVCKWGWMNKGTEIWKHKSLWKREFWLFCCWKKLREKKLVRDVREKFLCVILKLFLTPFELQFSHLGNMATGWPKILFLFNHCLVPWIWFQESYRPYQGHWSPYPTDRNQMVLRTHLKQWGKLFFHYSFSMIYESRTSFPFKQFSTVMLSSSLSTTHSQWYTLWLFY